jgi:hypothetical protein
MPTLIHFVSGDTIEVEEDLAAVQGALRSQDVGLTSKKQDKVLVEPTNFEYLQAKSPPDPPKMP